MARCETIEVFHSRSDFESEGFYVRTDDRASAPTKKSIWRHNNSDRIIYYDGNAKEWRLGYKKQQNTDYLYSSNQSHYTYLVVMSPSRVGSSQSSNWRIFSLARLGLWPFPLQLEIKNRPKTSRNFDFDLIFLLFSYLCS